MIDFFVEVDGIKISSIVDIRFHKGINEHGNATVKCIVEEDIAESVLKSSSDVAWMAIRIGEESTGSADTPVFSGIISDVRISNVRGVVELEINLVGGSILMDLQPVTRTYQEDDSKFSEVVSYMEKKYKSSKIMLNFGKGCKEQFKPENDFLVQYNETDYAFLRRCASMQGFPLITTINGTDADGINIDIGLMKNGGGNKIETKFYKRGKNLLEYINAKKLGVESIKEDDFEIIEVSSRDYFDIGEKVTIDGKQLYVYSVDAVYDSSKNRTEGLSNVNKDEFWHTYILAEDKKFTEPMIYNYDMVGASLSAKVKKVEKDKVQIDTDIDVENDTKSKDYIKFPYSTVYSTNDGTGWYCMPEEGDAVRLYLPSEHEKDAYVISAIHLKEGSGMRDDPDKKFIMNKYKKMVEFNKESIVITNNDGMEIKLDDKKGISIVSNKDINIDADKEINIISKKDEVNISGKSSVMLKQGPSAYLELKGKATIKATSVHM